MAKAAPTSTATTYIPPIELAHANIVLIGDSPLICHAWSQKAKSEMLSKQMKKAKQGKEAKDPDQDYLDSLYPYYDDGYGFPLIAFKAAAVDACSFVDGTTKVQARGAFHIQGEHPDLLKINGTPRKREDMVRIGMGTADIRYRGEFEKWSVQVPLKYQPRALSLDQLINLFDIAGFGVGIGEWRPQKDGPYGRFHVQKLGEIV